MVASRNSRTFIALSLGFLLVSCSAAQPTVVGPSGSHELARYALIIEETPDGQVGHSWRPAEDFAQMQHRYSALGGSSFDGRMVRVGGVHSACDAHLETCIKLCTSSPVPIPIEGKEFQEAPERWLKRRGRWCEETCVAFYAQCIRGRGPWAEGAKREFSRIDTALDWIKSHREEIVVGTIVVVAGVALVAVVAASGGTAIIFVPLVLVASKSPPSGDFFAPQVAEASDGNP
jgi:hypothetical protein